MNEDLRHAEAHELIADLALEPGALARLTAATPPESDRDRLAALRAHVAGCPDCRRDVDAWLQTHARLDDATRASGRDRQATLAELGAERPILAPPALRERIRAEIARDPRTAARADRTRSVTAAEAAPGEAAPGEAGSAALTVSSILSAPSVQPVPVAATEPGPATPPAPARLLDFRRPSRIWRSALPLVAALAILVGGFAVVRDQQTRIDTARAEATELESLAASLDRLLADPDHKVVALAAADGSGRGTLAWSKHEIVVMSSALARPPAGSEYRCWLERDGTRTRVGTMWFAGDLAYWSGTLDEWATISFDQGGRFGVSLEKADGAGGGAPVLLGDLSG